MILFIRERPWLWFVALFSVLVLAWVFFLNFAMEHQPEEVELGESRPVKPVDTSADATVQKP
jgi:di/tricarboxylate transporter